VQITPGDLDVAVIGQLSPSQLPFDRKLEAGALEVKRFQATLRGGRLIEQSPEDAPMDVHRALVLAEHDSELDRSPVVVPASVLGEGEEEDCGPPVCSCIVL
jgi:hypothetical protein